MYYIDYSIITASFDDLEVMTEEELRYNFLLGNVVFNSANTSIDMQWEWIPLLDFSFSLFQIVKSLSYKENSFESFEFTESTENIKFVREGKFYPPFRQILFVPHLMNLIMRYKLFTRKLVCISKKIFMRWRKKNH